MENFIVLAVILLIIGAAVLYIVKEKKNGVKCIGCPDGATCGQSSNAKSGCAGCGGNCGGEANCGCHADTN